MARTYQRKTNYLPYAERKFSIRAVHRDPPDLDQLCAAYLHYTLVNYEKHQAERNDGEPPKGLDGAARRPTTHTHSRRRGQAGGREQQQLGALR